MCLRRQFGKNITEGQICGALELGDNWHKTKLLCYCIIIFALLYNYIWQKHNREGKYAERWDWENYKITPTVISLSVDIVGPSTSFSHLKKTRSPLRATLRYFWMLCGIFEYFEVLRPNHIFLSHPKTTRSPLEKESLSQVEIFLKSLGEVVALWPERQEKPAVKT